METKSFRKILVVFLILIILGLGNKFFILFAQGRNGFQTFLEVLETIKTRYFKKDLDETKMFYGAIRGLIYSLNDPYTRFLEPKAYSEMKVRMKGSFGGIGIQIGIRDNILTIISPIENTPAWRAGLKAMDQIYAIDDEPTLDLSIEEAVQKIRGPKGTKVKLKIMRKSFKKPEDFEIERDIISIEDLKSTMLKEDIGYIKLITFENFKTSMDLKKAILDLKQKGMRKLILDLRNNGGGLLENALEISSFFLEEGKPIVSTIDREGRKQTFYSEGENLGKFEMVVLINEASASASEILAGALKDNKTAVLIGEKTFGKASVQTIKPLRDGSALLFTVAKYLTPSGRDITEKGIEPDIIIQEKKDEVEDEKLVPVWPPDPKQDPVLNKALKLLEEKNAQVETFVKERVFLDTSCYLPYIKLNFCKC